MKKIILILVILTLHCVGYTDTSSTYEVLRKDNTPFGCVLTVKNFPNNIVLQDINTCERVNKYIMIGIDTVEVF